MEKPTQTHIKLLCHVVRYLFHTKYQGLHFKAYNQDPIRTYTDSDYGESSDRCYTSGKIHLFYGTIIPWCSKKQPTIALNTCEAEYVAASNDVQDMDWIRRLIHDLNNQDPLPTPFYIDNSGEFYIAHHSGKTRRRKHIEIKLYHFKHHLNKKSITLHCIPTAVNISDLSTKSILPDTQKTSQPFQFT